MSKTSTAKYVEGIGRRKNATARVRLFKGEATNSVNEKPIDKYFVTAKEMADAVRPLVVAGMMDKYYFTASVNGGGIVGQVGAVSLGIARALIEIDPELKAALKVEGLMTRDPRMVERKKYHHVKARKKPQFSKR